ncbi:MAG: glutamine--fructose-6-phosphate transaminase (isomerizing) [Halobacteria archaeon]|nr:glutamine--fructose-6-phosphate transaminase (isomerizing) [Halobacteria archaeon]
MCGIVGYTSDDGSEALEVLVNGLRNLDYRGYDSAGVALSSDSLDVYKKKGKIDRLEEILPETGEAKTGTGIGHTRWSTHGEPTDENAHPHTDCTGEIGVVHNGIIDNFDDLKHELASHEFSSDTDTEVIPHLIEEEIDAGAGFFEAFRKTVGRIEGSYAVAAVSSSNDEIAVARQDSPLILGYGDDENYVGSDVTAFIDYTDEVTYLENGDVALVTADDIEIYDSETGERVEREVETVDWEPEAAEKGGYDHYMLKEIHEQPQSLRQTLSGRIDEIEGEANLDVSLPDEYLNSVEEIQVVGAGTSYHACLVAEELMEEYADVRVTAEYSHEYDFDGGRDPWRTLVVAVTQSGETADTLSALKRAKRSGARTLAVTNTVGSTVTREADETLYIRAGPEIGVAATKTFVSQVATLGLLTVYVGRKRGALGSETASEILEDIRSLPGGVQQVLDNEDEVRQVAEEYADSDAFFYIGRKLGHPVSLEGALKLKEISYDHAEGFPAGELKHGPLALVTSETAVVAVLTEGTRPGETVNNVKEVKSREAPVIGVASSWVDGAEKYADTVLEVPDAGAMEPVLANVYLQLLAYNVADLKGRNIDKPRNLAKSVTVE